jgi:hypothetical protein
MSKEKTINIGDLTITEAYPHLRSVANAYGLKLNKVKDFRLARLILSNLYNRQWC